MITNINFKLYQKYLDYSYCDFVYLDNTFISNYLYGTNCDFSGLGSSLKLKRYILI